MKFSTFSLTLLFISISTFGQVQTNSTTSLSSYGSGVNMRVVDIPALPQELDHSIYLMEGWSVGDILLENNRVIEKCSLKYDIANGYIEIVGEHSIKAVPEGDVKQFSFDDDGTTRWFLSTGDFKSDKKIHNSLMEVLVDGDIKLLRHAKVDIIKPNGGFTDQRRAGADAITSMREDTYYLSQGKKLFEIDNKKKALEAFGNYGEDVKAWAKREKLKFGKQEDLTKIVKYYAALVDNT